MSKTTGNERTDDFLHVSNWIKLKYRQSHLRFLTKLVCTRTAHKKTHKMIKPSSEHMRNASEYFATRLNDATLGTFNHKRYLPLRGDHSLLWIRSHATSPHGPYPDYLCFLARLKAKREHTILWTQSNEQHNHQVHVWTSALEKNIASWWLLYSLLLFTYPAWGIACTEGPLSASSWRPEWLGHSNTCSWGLCIRARVWDTGCNLDVRNPVKHVFLCLSREVQGLKRWWWNNLLCGKKKQERERE